MSFLNTALAAAVALACAGTAHAGTYDFTVSEGLSHGSGFVALNANPYTGPNTASASFVYTGDLDFSNTAKQNSGPTGDLNSSFGFSQSNVSDYVGSGRVMSGATTLANYDTLESFLGSSGSASNFSYGSYYAIDLGMLAAGTILTVTHDDGASVFQGTNRLNTTTAGPTVAITESVTVGHSGDTTLYYGRQNGSPSVLQVAVPEPASLALLGVGLFGLGIVRQRAPRRSLTI